MTGPTTPRGLKVFTGKNAPDVKPVDWLVEKFLARGAGTLLFGQPGVSKTVHAAHLVACLVTGKRFAHLKTVQRGLRVLYLDFDGSWQWNHELFTAAFRGVGVEGLQDSFVYFSPNTEECIVPGQEDGLLTLEAIGAELATTVKAMQIDVVVCDSLGQMMVGDTNSGQDVTLALRLGLNPARRAGAAVLVIDHATKSAAGGVGVPTPMGSQQKRAWARVSVALEREEGEDGHVTRWSVDKSNTAPFKPFLTRLTFTNDGEALHSVRMDFIREAGSRLSVKDRPNQGMKAQQKILNALKDGPRSRGELGKGGTFDCALLTLRESGQVVRLGRGVYSLPDGDTVPPPPQPLASGGVVEVVAARGTDGEDLAVR